MTHYRNHNTIIPDYEANPPPLPQRRIPQQSNCGTILTSPQVTVPPMNPIPMPVFPLHNTPSKYSPYSPTRFHIDKSCQYRWSWKYCGIALILLCMALTATLIYFTGHLHVVTVGNRRIWQSSWVNDKYAVMADTSDEYFTMQGFGDPVSASGQGEKAGSQASSSNDCSSSLVGNLATGEYTITGRKLSDKTSSLQKRRQKSNKRTAELSSEELEERKKKRRLYMKNYRTKQSKEATQARLQHLRQSAAERRDTESEQARKARLQQMRQHAAGTRDSESELAKEARLQQVRQHAAETRDSESELAKEARLQQMRQHAAETRDSESELAKKARLQQAPIIAVQPRDDNSNCILVEDTKVVAQNDEPSDVAVSLVPTEESITTTSTVGSLNPIIQQNIVKKQPSQKIDQHILEQQQEEHEWLAPIEVKEFDVPYSVIMPPYRFWRSEFQNKESRFVYFNFTLSWTANFAIYCRRGAPPSITNYDFLEFVKGGRVEKRLKRSLTDNDLFNEDNESNSVNVQYPHALTISFNKSSVKDSKNILHIVPVNPAIIHNDNNVKFIGKAVNTQRKSPSEFGMSNLDHLPSIKLAKRSADDDDDFPDSLFVMVNVSLLLYLDAGRWFTSVYNDDLRPQNITLIISEAEGISTACPNDCSGHGSCYLGKCDCIDGHEGIDCSKSVCPVLCSNHGKYGGGLCHCEEGWKGTECDVPEHDCQVPDCSGNGQCINGICVCSPGWQGPYCNQADCPDPLCSSHGKCVMGKCYCKAGWQGMNCSDVDPLIYKCLPGCSDHGIYDLHTKSCMCDSYWTGADCSKELCNLDCGLHGLCNSGKCECDPGWTGDHCDLLPCDSRCAEHGQCKNGTCVCSQGWNGRHCTLSGCKNSCNHHGTCTFEDGEYHCVCSDGWGGIDCAVHLEMDCNDDVDNDKDGMTDCSDSECCSHPVCADHIMCLASNDPVEVLLRKQPPSVTASFYQRLKFLIEENSVQSYAHMDEYSESRVSVMRGQVISPLGLGIVGVRVSVDRGSRFGFTLTRAGGWFDVMVNGGGAVTLQFQRLPFRPVKRTVYVPWNEIVDLAPIVMQLSSDNNIYKKIYSSVSGLPITMEYGAIPLETPESTGPCKDHDTETLHPVIVPSWMPEKVGGIPGRSVVFAETQILQESIPIPGSGLHLMYHSSQAAGYMSTIFMRLTHDVVPHSLIHVHVRVEIEGSLYFKTYESDPNITHVFAWNKRNVYKQKVYGVAQAKISVGYQYKTCPAIVWETQTAMLKGFDVDISDIGGWNLDIHHHYNFHDGILQKGDGTTMHFKQFPRVVKIVMGTGAQRSLDCLDCNGPAKDSRLLSPVALTSGPDGSLYVGDFNLVRRITPDGNVYTVLRLRATKVSYQYYICISPADGHLYISDSEKRQVLRVLSLDNVGDPSINFEPVVGSGQRCIPGDDTFCGDEGPAKDAKLSHPKGLAITADNTMYIADATNIRAVDPNGIIHTIVGHHSHLTNWVPIPCEGAVPAEQVQLQWPTGLSLSPLDGSLYFIDDHLVLKLTDDLKVKVVAGTPLHCCTSTNDHCPHQKTSSVTEGMKILKKKRARNSWKATSTSLGSVLSIAFSPTGDLFISEYDSRKVNTVHLVDTSGRISVFSGRPKEKRLSFNICECTNGSSVTTTESVPSSECQCGFLIDESSISEETMLSSNIHLKIVSALTVTPNGVLYVVDQENLHILSMEHYLPAPDESGEYRIPYPPTSEIYVFNKYGQHIATKDLTSGNTVYSFLYSKNTSFGKLSTVTDSSGNKIQFLRDYSNVVTAIENRQNNHKCDLKISNVGFLVRFVEKGIVEVELDYDSNSGLLTSRANLYGQGAGEAYIYNYGVYGRLSDIVLPTGETVNINSKLTFKDGLAIDVIAFMQSVTHVEQEMDQQNVMTLEMEEQDSIRLVVKEGVSTMEAVSLSNGTYSVNLPCGVQLQGFSVVQHPLLELSLPVEAEMLPMWNHQFLKMGDDLINIMQWTYKLVGDVRKPEQTLQRELWVNHSRVLGIEYDQTSKKETFYDHDKTTLLVIKYDSTGLPHVWTPIGESPPVNITYDIFKRSDEWKWGIQSEKYSYDNHGLLSDISTPKDGITHFSYNKLNKLSEIILPSERKFDFQYDDDGGLRHVVLPSGTKHSFSCQPSIGFLRVTYTPPGSTKPYIQHYSHSGSLLKTVFPSDGPRILYRYYSSGQLAEVVHGDGRSQINYSPATKFPNEVLHSGRDFEYRWGYQYTAALLTEERIDFVAKTGLSSAKFTYEYDTNFRLTAIQGRIGGQTLSEHSLRYNYKTGAPEQMGPFKISKSGNETALSDGIAFFSRIVNPYFQQIKISVTIHRMEVFRMEFAYDPQSRISQTRTNTRNVGINSYSNVKNYTWDSDGQLVGVEAQEPWGFKYDANGNMLSLNYRGNAIPMEYNEMDRIVKFGEGVYHYDNRGYVIQNAREEKFHYNAKGLLVRAVKRGRFDVRYYYDHLDRLSTRKDNYGNVTQFFYTNHQKPYEVSQIYSPRDGKLMSLIYDDSGHLIYAQVYRHKYYVATDQCGTPVMVFNQYGEGIREIMRSPYGHIVYDSNPYLYLPIDFCGGLLDQVTSLVHMSNGKVYDPLIGQWMTPMWEGILDRIANPSKLHLYRINGNDPVNMGYSFKHLTGYHSWFTVLGYDLKSLAPQLYLDELLNNDSPSATRQGGLVGLFSSDASKQTISMSMPELTYSRSSIQLNKHPLADNFGVASGFYTRLSEYHLQEKYSLSSYLESKKTNWPPNDFPTKNPASVFSFQGLGAASDPPFGKGVLVSCTSDGRTIVRSVPSANPIYRDVFTSVFNQTFLLPFTLIHNGQQDVFYFVKEEMWRADEDKAQLKRLSGQINTTFHEKDVGSAETGLTAGKFTDFKIHGTSAIINLRYGTTTGKEKQRLLHHVKGVTARKAWHREKEIIKNGYIGAIDWSTTETDEILKSGSASNYETEYIHDIQSYPEMAEDSFNIRFVKKTVKVSKGSGKQHRQRRNVPFNEETGNISHNSTSTTVKKTDSNDAQKHVSSPEVTIRKKYSNEELRKCKHSPWWLWFPWIKKEYTC